VSDFLKGKGFQHYEVSNFSIPGKNSRHNLKYWKGESVAALGPSATGFLLIGDKGLRYKWENREPKFNLEILGPQELRLEKLYTLLRTDIGIQGEDFFEDKKSWIKLLDSWQEKGFILSKNGNTKLTSKGYLLMDSLMNDIFNQVKMKD
jgi:oxygen-independent coproporphyrinogen-3 oxidase